MVQSSSISITPALHADNHRTGGSDPLTGAVGINQINPVTNGLETSVFDAAAPVAWADLDLSAVIGANRCIVGLIGINKEAAGDIGYSVIPKGTGYGSHNADLRSQGVSHIELRCGTAYATRFIVMTDTSGVIQHIASANNNIQIFVESYQVVGA